MKARLSAQAWGGTSKVASEVLPPSKPDRCSAVTWGGRLLSTSTTARSPCCSAASENACSAWPSEPASTSSLTCFDSAGRFAVVAISVLLVEHLGEVVGHIVVVVLVVAIVVAAQLLHRLVVVVPLARVLEQKRGDDGLAR